MDLYRHYNSEDIVNFINVEHSTHSMTRASQRGIDMDTIKLGMLYSNEFFKQGLIFYVVKTSYLPDSLTKQQRLKLENLVIVIAGDSNQIITCYKNKNAMHLIKRKSKRLSVKRNAA